MPRQERARFYLRRPAQLWRNHAPTLWRLARGERRTRAAWQAQCRLQTWLQDVTRIEMWEALERGKRQEARIKNQESRVKQPATRNPQPATRNLHHEDDLIPESALDALRVPRWRQALLRPFVRRAMGGEAALVSGSMRFLGVLLVDRLRDLPGVVLRGLFPGQRWLQLRYDLSPRRAFWRQFIYPFQVLGRGIGALLQFLIHHS